MNVLVVPLIESDRENENINVRIQKDKGKKEQTSWST